MSLDVDAERRFYDAVYAPRGNASDADLRLDRRIFLAEMDNPRSGFFERRRLYRRAFERLFAEPAAGLRALDYGCGTGEWGVVLATEGARTALLDLSPAAIEVGLRRARASGVAERVTGHARDASDLSCFGDGEFDVVFACAAIHHTLKYPRAFDEVVRVIRPGGRLVLAEGWGNPALDGLRRLRWRLANEPEEAGEGLIFGPWAVRLLQTRFRSVEVEPLNAFGMAKRLLRGRFHEPWARLALGTLEGADRALFRALPPLRRFCGEAVVVAVK
ncbi:MAG: methyltransferase domain-containing protein [Acidobacteria bacterium]|nr:methyltransferase domain-containing protein [Acidobacteriota bacterium]